MQQPTGTPFNQNPPPYVQPNPYAQPPQMQPVHSTPLSQSQSYGQSASNVSTISSPRASPLSQSQSYGQSATIMTSPQRPITSAPTQENAAKKYIPQTANFYDNIRVIQSHQGIANIHYEILMIKPSCLEYLVQLAYHNESVRKELNFMIIMIRINF